MGLRFCFGASGAGKSSKLQEEIVARSIREPETEFLLIVPDQFTMQTQMDLVLAHPDRGIMNADVLSFGRLSHRIMEELGEEKRMILDDTGKSLILRKLSQELSEQLPVIGGNLNKIGYIHEVKSAISELMQYGIGVKEMEELVAFSGKRGALYHKLEDLSRLYGGFLDYIKEKYITTEETLDILSRRLSDSELIKRSVVVFDGFTGFTPVQENVLRELMLLAKEVTVSVLIDGEENPYRPDGEHKLFYLSKKTVYRLEKLARDCGVERQEDLFLRQSPLPRFKDSRQLRHLEKHLFRYPVVPYEEEGDALFLFEASTPAEEARQVCIKIRQLVRTAHYCYRDFAVITGNLEAYAAHFEAEAQKYDIPVYIDRTRGILLNPFIEWIRSALLVTAENFSYSSVFHYLRSGLCDIEREEADRLENYVLALGIRGKRKWNSLFTAGTSFMQEGELEQLNRSRQSLLLQLSPLTRRVKTAGERVRMLYQFILENRIQEKLLVFENRFKAQADAARAKEYGQIYHLVIDLLDQIDALLGADHMDAKEFAEILDAGFGEIQVGTIPQDVDRIVVGDMERTRLKEIKVLFFVGINDGNIPQNTGSGGILSDIDREFLRESPYALKPTPREQMYIQRLYLYMNMTKPSRMLYLSYCKVNGEGKSLRPAYLIDTMKKLFPSLETDYPQQKPWEELIEAKKDGLSYFADMLREYASGTMEEDKRRKFFAIYHAYLGDRDYASQARRLVSAAFAFYREKPLGKAIVGKLYGSYLIGSVSRLEQYASCAYAHFLKYGLSLKEREEYGFEAVDMGNVFHGVLELFSEALPRRGRTWFDFSGIEAGEILTQSLEQYAAGYGQTVLYSTARNEYALKRMHRILCRTVMTLQDQLKKGAFLPEHFEMSFSEADHLDAVNIALTQEEKMRLTGRIDRIDTYEDEKQVYVKVIDFKSGSRKFDLAALYYGLQLQLVVYMNAAVEMEKKKHPDKVVKPAALLYYHIADPLIKVQGEFTPQEIDGLLKKELRMNGVVEGSEELVTLLDKEFDDKSDVIPVERKKDGSFSARSALMSGEELWEISQFVHRKIRQIGREITAGSIPLNPCKKGTASACDYCSFKAVCGYDGRIGGYGKRELLDLDEEEVMERIMEENKDQGDTQQSGGGE